MLHVLLPTLVFKLCVLTPSKPLNNGTEFCSNMVFVVRGLPFVVCLRLVIVLTCR
uniref:Uncharacterized protein n=1 Tax=Rhizophora mucronata TaxID=61149 RepID=A0A2P2N2R1_RHIMU